MTSNIIPFTGVHKTHHTTFQPGDKVRVRHRDWERGEVFVSGTVIRQDAQYVAVRFSDHYKGSVLAIHCELAPDAPDGEAGVSAGLVA